MRYAQFLLREVLPQHDALCLEEGRLMLAHAAGDPQAAAALSALQGRTARLYDHLWAGDGKTPHPPGPLPPRMGGRGGFNAFFDGTPSKKCKKYHLEKSGSIPTLSTCHI